MATVRSALFFARQKRLHFHFFVDEEGEPAMRHEIEEMEREEPVLASRAARFEMHGEDVLKSFFGVLRDTLPAECLGAGSSLFGDSGWIRLFVHEIFRNRPDVDLLIFLDAGDFIVLEDLSLVLGYRAKFSDEQVAGGPHGGAVPFQLFDLQRMRNVNWTYLVQEQTESSLSQWSKSCSLGEGYITQALSFNSSLWYDFDAEWVIEPREFGGLQGPGGGVRNLWANHKAVWLDRSYPGLGADWTELRVHCPQFTENFLTHVFLSNKPTDMFAYYLAGDMASSVHVGGKANLSLKLAGLFEAKYQSSIQCNQRMFGVHFTSTLKSVPWARLYMNYWAGPQRQPWGEDHDEWRKRSLAMARADLINKGEKTNREER
eukprot:TRINITY_DN30094_c0_g1_i1.p1 TRINITY_DN30094_c0_g1~~TRINITY_DN30094_c0_g1_i1.p1  ORF type:complete len:419 (+),score=62.63 TRINITY_DN30094_c0_g1_i1:138-1259(+)